LGDEVLPAAWSPPGQPAERLRVRCDHEAWLVDDDRVVYRFTGSPRRDDDYPRVIVVERRAAVAVLPIPVARRDFRVRFLDAETREVEFHLAEPLGDRVLVNVGGVPATVGR
jgi:hypothetical protein